MDRADFRVCCVDCEQVRRLARPRALHFGLKSGLQDLVRRQIGVGLDTSLNQETATTSRSLLSSESQYGPASAACSVFPGRFAVQLRCEYCHESRTQTRLLVPTAFPVIRDCQLTMPFSLVSSTRM